MTSFYVIIEKRQNFWISSIPTSNVERSINKTKMLCGAYIRIWLDQILFRISQTQKLFNFFVHFLMIYEFYLALRHKSMSFIQKLWVMEPKTSTISLKSNITPNVMVQGVHQNCLHFVFCIFSDSKGTRIKMLDNFMEPIQFWFQKCPDLNS